MGIGNGDPIEETTQEQILVLSLSPQATELDGARLTCRVTTTNGKIFEETITVQIKGQQLMRLVTMIECILVTF